MGTTSSNRYHSGAAILWIAIAIIVLAGAGLAAYYYTDWFKPDNDGQAEQEATEETADATFPSETKLASLGNYIAEISTEGQTYTQEVYSDTNYRETTPDGIKLVLVDGTLWSTSTVASGVPDGAKADSENKPMLIRYAKTLSDFAADTSTTASYLGACEVANRSGQMWQLRSSRESQAGNPVYQYDVCIDSDNSYILSLTEGLNLGADSESVHSKVTVTQIDGVEEFTKNDV